MKMKKKILIMICLIVLIFSIAGVSAMDVNQAIEDANDMVSGTDTLGVSLSNDEVVGSADNGTYTDLQKKIDDADEGSTVNLENNYTYGSSVDSGSWYDLRDAIEKLPEGDTLYLNADFHSGGTIDIDKSIIIDGNGHKISGTLVFNIISNNVGLKNIIFEGLKGSYNYQEIMQISSDNNIISNCTFHGNERNGWIGGNVKGGALYIIGNNNMISDCNFNENHLTDEMDTAIEFKYGGAIYCEGDIKVINSNFNYNLCEDTSDYYQTAKGGAIYCDGNIDVINSSFIGNSLLSDSTSGSAIYCTNSTNIINSIFENNEGSFAIDTFKINVVNSTFINNTEAFSAFAAYANIENCTFINNNYSLWKFYPFFELNINSSIVHVGESIEISVIFWDDVPGNVTVRVNDDERIVQIVDNAAILVLSDLNEGIYNVTVTYSGNEYYDQASSKDRFKVVNNSTFTILDLKRLIADANDGDTIYLTHDYYYDDFDIWGGIYLYGKNIKISGNGHIIDGNNQIRIFKIDGSDIVLDNITFINGKFGEGAVIYSNAYLNVTNCNFINNSAYSTYTWGDHYGRGGAIYSDGGVVNIVNSNFINNTAYEDGAAISGNEYDVSITGSSFINNHAGDVAGAISGYESLVIGDNCIFENNTPNDYKKLLPLEVYYDSSIYFEGDNVTIYVYSYGVTNISLVLELDGQKYPMLLIDEEASLTFSDLDAGKHEVIVTFDGNDYYESFNQNSSFTILDDSYRSFSDLQALIDNATDGDTIYLNNNYIHDERVDSNKVYVNKNLRIVGNNHIIDGNSVGYEGYLEIDADDVVLKDITFINFYDSVLREEESSHWDVYYPDMNVTIINCRFENNEGWGGVVSLTHTNMTIIDSTFINNGANGVIKGYYGNTVISNSSFINNSALYWDSHVCSIYGGNIKVSDSIFSGNIISRDNPEIVCVYDIYAENSLLVENSTFINNSTDMDDYIYVESGNKTVINCTFIKKDEKNNTDIEIIADDIIFGQDLIVEVNLSENATGTVNLIINSNTYTQSLVNAYAKFNISNLAADTYELVVNYLGDDKFLPASANTTVNVNKKDTSLTVTASDVIYGDNLIVDVSLSESVNDKVTVNVGGADYSVALTNGKGQINVSGLSAGSYVVSASFAGNANLSSSGANATAKVNKKSTSIAITAKDVVYGNDLVIGVALSESVNDNVTVVIDARSYSVALTDGKGQLNVSGLAVGSHVISVNYEGNDNLSPSNANATAKVSAKAVSLDVTAKDIAYGDKLVIDVSLSESVNDKVSVNVGGKDYSVALTNGKGQLSVSGLAAGKYVISANYAGNDNLSSASANTTVNVNKKATSLTVTASDITYGDKLVIDVSLSESVNDNVTVNVGGKDYSVALANGKGQVNVSALPANKYVISASFAGNVNLTSASANKSVTVNKANSNVTVNANDILIGDVTDINIALGNDESGKLNVTLSDKDGIVTTTTLDITSKNIKLPISDLKAGEYEVSVIYGGDNNYVGSSSSDSFKVSKLNPQIIIDAPNVKEEEDVTITVTIANATGNVVVDVNNKKYNLTLENNKAVLTLSGLAIGVYNVSVSYDGNDILLAGVNATSFEVESYAYTYKDLQALIDKTPAGGSITLVRDYLYDASVDNKSIIISKAITIDGNGHNVNGLDKAAIFEVTANNVVLRNLKLTNATADKGGAVFITGSNVNIENVVFEYNSADVGGAVYSQGAKTTISNSSFKNNKATAGAGAALYGNGAEVISSTFMNNKAQNASGLSIYGDDALILKSNFTSNEANIGAGAIVYGLRSNVTESIFEDNLVKDKDSLLLGASLDDALSGSAYGAGLIIFGKDAVVAASEFVGNTAVNGAGLVIGADNCIVSDSLFENNLAEAGAGLLSYGESTVVDNSVFKDNTAQEGAGVVANGDNILVSASVFTNNNANQGAGLVINATNANVTESEFTENNAKEGAGIIVKGKNATVSNSSFDKNTAEIGTAILVEPEASLIIEENDVPDKPLTVAYVSTLEITVGETEVGENATIVVTVSSASLYPITGKITIKFEGTEYKLDVVNNSVSKVISGLPSGTYNVSASYSGDINNTASSATVNFTVSKISNVTITPTFNGTHVGETPVITIEFPDDATGNVTATVENKTYTAKIKDGVATLTLDELDKGTHAVDVLYSGDDKYASSKYNLNITIESGIIITAPEVVKYYGGSERFIVTLTDYKGNAISGAKITIEINGVEYTRTTNDNGTASMAVNLNSARYDVTVSYGNDSINSSVTIKSTVEGNNITKIFRNATQYYAKFVDTKGNILKNTMVTFNINGVFYDRKTNDDGFAKLNINLNPGEYIITALNSNSSEMYSNVVTVLPNIAENNNLTKYYKNDSQYVVRLLDDEGNPVGAGVNVTFNINGVLYVRTTNATGHAKLNINLGPGTYIITAMYKDLMVANTITVLPVLEAKDLNMKYKDGSKFEAKLVDGQGKPYEGQKVSFNVNGVFYDRTTDASGIARLNINLMPGVYIITSSYNGMNIANKITISS